MKKICFLIIILLSFLVAKANNPDSTNRKWELGVFYLPSTIDEFYDVFSRETNYLLGFSGQANIYFKEKISLETGINYKNKRIEKIGWMYSASPGASNGDDFNYIEIHKINIVELPLKFKFYLQKKSKLSFCFICGITNSFYSRETIRMHIDYLGHNASILNVKYYNLIVNLGLGGQYDINNTIGILFEPSIGYFAVGGLQECLVLELKTGVIYHF